MLATLDVARPAVAATDSLDALVNAARRAEHDGDWGEAERVYQRAIELTHAGAQPERGPQLMRWLGRVFFDRGDYDRANAILEASLVTAQRLEQR
ncbi:MAG: hypothetical protein ACT443_04515, partial [Gemmatimonadota bacterium]